MRKVGNSESEWVGQFDNPKMKANGVGHFGTPTEPQSKTRARLKNGQNDLYFCYL